MDEKEAEARPLMGTIFLVYDDERLNVSLLEGGAHRARIRAWYTTRG